MVSRSTRAYREDENPLAGFMASHVEMAPDDFLPRTDLLKSYLAWAKSAGVEPLNRNTFYERVR